MLEVTVFTLDLEFVSHLCRARARGCGVKVLLDLQQCLEPSCTHHAAALKALRIGNVAMRCPRFDVWDRRLASQTMGFRWGIVARRLHECLQEQRDDVSGSWHIQQVCARRRNSAQAV